MDSHAAQLSLFPVDSVAAEEQQERAAGFVIRESARARRLSIKVFPRGQVEVIVPRRTRAGEVAAFVAENREWITRTRQAFAVEHVPEPFRLPLTVQLPATGRVFAVRYRPDPSLRAVNFRVNGSALTLSGNTDDPEQCVRALRRWLAGVARREFEPRLQALSGVTGISYQKMQVRAQRTCWGSRSSSGTVSLNLCLLFQRPEVVRYLMIHELCHGRHMNHSRQFWKLVGQFEPRYRRLDKELGEGWKSVPSWLGIY